MGSSQNVESLGILLVDDSAINQKIILRKLKSLDTVIDIANSGLEAIYLFQKRRYAIVLMDIMMPGMDGLETCKKIREMNGEKHQPIVIAISSNSEAVDNKKYLEAGLDGSLDKKFEAFDLINLLKEKGIELKTKMATKSSLDLKQLREFSEGDNDFIVDVLETFLKDGERNWDLLKKYQEEGSIEDVKFMAHKIKSAFRFIGNAYLGELAHEIEMKSENPENKELINQIIEKMNPEFINFIKDIKHELEILQKK